MGMTLEQRFDLSGQVAIVTGGAGLLGAGYCHTLSAAGARVVVADIDGPAAETLAGAVTKASGVKSLAVRTDVADQASVRAMVESALAEFGRIDVLVNNAALDPKFDAAHAGSHASSFEELPLEAWQQSLAVNITSTYALVGPDQRLYAREGRPTEYKPVTYTVAKAAVIGLTRFLATYFAGKGIRVNTMTPGGVFAGHDEEFVRRYSARTVLGRMAEKEEMSSALLFLVSDASSYMTGANLVVDGGWTAW